MADLYGVNVPFGYYPDLPLGGNDIVNAGQFGGPSPAAIAAERERTQPVVTGPVVPQAPVPKGPTPQQQFMSWPDYLANHGGDPAVAYDDYVNVAAPSFWAAMGLPPGQIKQAQDLFQQQVTKPASVAQAVPATLENLGASLKQNALSSYYSLKAMAPWLTDQEKADAIHQAAVEMEKAPTLQGQKELAEAQAKQPTTLGKLAQIFYNKAGFAENLVAGAGPLAVQVGATALATAAGGPVAGMGTLAALWAASDYSESMQHRIEAEHKATGKSYVDIISNADWMTPQQKQAGLKAITTAVMGTAATGGLARVAGAGERAFARAAEGEAAKAVGPLTREATAAQERAIAEAGKYTTGRTLATRAGAVAAEPVALGGAEAAGQVVSGQEYDPQAVASMAAMGFLKGPADLMALGFRPLAKIPAEQVKELMKVRAAPPFEAPKSTAETLGDVGEFPPAAPGEPPAPPAPPGAPRAERTAGPMTTDEQAEAYRRMADERLNDEAAVRALVGLPEKTKAGALRQTVLADEAKAVADAQTPADKIAALDALAEAADKKGKGDVVERAQAEADKLRALEGVEPPTPADHAAQLDAYIDQSVATHIAQDLVKEVADEIETQKGQGPGAPAVPPAPEVPLGPVSAAPEAAVVPPVGGRTPTSQRPTGLAKNPPLQQGPGREVKGGPGLKRGAGVNQEKPSEAVGAVPRIGEPTGVAGPGGPPVAAGPERARGIKQGKRTVEPIVGGLTKEVVKAHSDAYYVRKMIDEMGFDRETAKELYNEDPAHWRDQVEQETTKGKVKPTPEQNRALEAAVRAVEEEGPDRLTKVFKQKKTRDEPTTYYTWKELSDQFNNRFKNQDYPIVSDLLGSDWGMGSNFRTPEQYRQKARELFESKYGFEHVEKEGGVKEELFVQPRRPIDSAFVNLMRSGKVTSKQALNYLAARSPSPLTRLLARQLRTVLADAPIPIRLEDNARARGAYYSYYDTVPPEGYSGATGFRHGRIVLDSVTGINHQTLMHELTHAATVRILRGPATPLQKFAVMRIQNVLTQAREAVSRGEIHPGEYGLERISDFVAEAFGNPAFQKALDRIPYRDPVEGRALQVPTLWQEFKNAIADIITRLRGHALIGKDQMSLLHAAIAHSTELFDTKSKVSTNPKEIGLQREEYERKEKETEDAFAHTPHDAIVGNHPETLDRTHIAYRAKDGTYNLYEVTPENPRGDPETKRVGLSGDEVRRAIGEGGSQPLERSGVDFRAEPKNNSTELNGWKDGARQFAAFKQADGTWNVYKANDLGDRTQRGPPQKFKDIDAVIKAYREGGYLKTEAQDAARIRDEQPRDIGHYQGPGKLNRNWWDWTAPVKYLSAQMEQQFGKLPEYMRPDIPALLKNSWANRDIRTMERDEWNPLRDKGRQLLKEHSVPVEQFDKDITALVSEERSAAKLKQEGYEDLPALKAKVTANLDAARAHLAAMDPKYLQQLKEYARDLKKYADATIDQQVAFGLMPAERATAIKSAYEFYVPIQKGQRTSTGKRATGASAESEHPMQRLVDQRRSTILRGYDNMEKRAIYELAKNYNIVKEDGSKMFDLAPILKYGFDKDGMVTTVLDPLVMDSKAIAVMIDGKPYRIAIHDEDFLNAVKDANTPKLAAMKGIFHGAAVFNALYGGLKTAASPVFAVKNYIRDAATALAQSDPRISIPQLSASLVNPKIWLAALHDAAEVGKNTPGGKHGPIADFAAKVRDAGGLIDRRAAYGLDAVVDDVNANIDPGWLHRLPGAVRKQFSIEHGAITKPLTMWTKTLENATRMAVFDAAKKSGLSDNEAAVQAKTTTVNFEPKGAYAGVINPLYVFANAKLQGTRTYAERLGLTGLKGGNALERLQRGNRRTQLATGLGLFIGMLAAKYGYDTSEKDKDGRSTYGKLSDYQKDDYLTTKSGGPSLPLPPELAASYVLGQSIVDSQMNDRWPDSAMRQQKAAIRFGSAMAQTFLPGGTSMSDPVSDTQGGTTDYLLRLVMPTWAMTTVGDLALNRTTFGSPVVTGQRPNVPLYATNAKNYPDYAAATKTMHDTTGLNVAPQELKHFVDQWIKPQVDLYNEITNAEPEKYATGETKPGVLERTFFQKASPFTDKQDLQEIKDRVVANNYDPLKRGKLPQLQMFEQSDKQIKAAMKGWDNMTPEQKKRASERADAVRVNTLKRYQQAIQQAEGQP